MDYMPMLTALKAKSSSMEHIIVVRDEAPPGTVSFSRLMEDTRLDRSTANQVYKSHLSPHQVMHLAPTGGTTGLPKLVPKTHNNHLTKAYYFARTLELGPREVGLAFTPLNHDAPHLLNLCFTILFGGTTVLCPSTRAGDILEHIEREKVTYCFFVPALLADMLHSPELERRDLSSLHTIATGGAHCPTELVKLAQSRLDCCFHNCYGMTEGAATVTRNHDPLEVVAQTVGQRICPYDEYRIVGEAGDEVPAGEEGELATRGPCMVSGYYKSEAEHKLVFTADGFFRTGDLARFDKAGNLVITGRRKDIINRGGDKVSAIDVEEMVVRYPGVLAAAVVGMPDPRLGERVCAYVQPVPQQVISAEEILSHLKAQGASLLLLPERIEVVPELPLTAMGKVDKQRLREDIARKLKAEGKG
jgi:non-ribosomal peptide synthetase component E (peptide arylation enzyme)